MKYVLLVLAILFSATTSARIFEYQCNTVQECNQRSQEVKKEAEEINKLPAKEKQRLAIESLGPVEEQHAYYGSGYKIADHDVYINGKKHHCIEYQSETQCHID